MGAARQTVLKWRQLISNWEAPQPCQSSVEETVSLWGQRERERKASLAWLKAVCHKDLTAVFLGSLEETAKRTFWHRDTKTSIEFLCVVLLESQILLLCLTEGVMTKENDSLRRNCTKVIQCLKFKKKSISTNVTVSSNSTNMFDYLQKVMT